MILLDECPVCLNRNLANKLHCTDHTTSKEKFTIVSCETCDFTFTNPRPKDESLADYYKSDMYISHTNRSKGLFNWTYQVVRKYLQLPEKDWVINSLNLNNIYQKILVCPQSTDSNRSISAVQLNKLLLDLKKKCQTVDVTIASMDKVHFREGCNQFLFETIFSYGRPRKSVLI